jgi:hypothetical protein
VRSAFGEQHDSVNNQKRKARNFMMALHVGKSVVVKSGILDPDFGLDISGWQGRIEEVDDGDTVFIRWDSITLQGIGMDIIIRCENENLDWQVMTLYKDDIEVSTARDTEADVDRIASQLKMEMIGDPRLDGEQ